MGKLTSLNKRGLKILWGNEVNSRGKYVFGGLNEENIYNNGASEKHIFDERKGYFFGLGAIGAAKNEK